MSDIGIVIENLKAAVRAEMSLAEPDTGKVSQLIHSIEELSGFLSVAGVEGCVPPAAGTPLHRRLAAAVGRPPIRDHQAELLQMGQAIGDSMRDAGRTLLSLYSRSKNPREVRILRFLQAAVYFQELDRTADAVLAMEEAAKILRLPDGHNALDLSENVYPVCGIEGEFGCEPDEKGGNDEGVLSDDVGGPVPGDGRDE